MSVIWNLPPCASPTYATILHQGKILFGENTLSERKTENLVRERLRSLDYFEQANGITVEEQKSEIAKVKKLLSKASKNATGKPGYPEFIISSRKDTAFLIVFECKASVKKHESTERNKPVEYAVDGVLHYARHLARHYTVVAVAVSGMSASAMSVASFLVPAGGGYVPWSTKAARRLLTSFHGVITTGLHRSTRM